MKVPACVTSSGLACPTFTAHDNISYFMLGQKWVSTLTTYSAGSTGRPASSLRSQTYMCWPVSILAPVTSSAPANLEVAAQTGFELAVAEDLAEVEPPSEAEIEALHRLDPLATRRLEFREWRDEVRERLAADRGGPVGV